MYPRYVTVSGVKSQNQVSSEKRSQAILNILTTPFDRLSLSVPA